MAEPAGSNYPSSLDDSTSLLADVANQKYYTVSGAHNSSTTTLTMTATITGVTAPGYLVNGRTGEIVHFATISTTQFTGCTRGADGTANAAMNDGDILYHVIAANYHNQMKDAILAIEGDSIYVRAGWVPAGNTWTYASATSFTITGVDKTTTYTKGTKLKCTDNSTTKYFYVTSSSFSSNTTVNITGGSDYSLAGGAITNPYYSYVQNPQGFPAAFNYTPTGLSASGVTLTGRFRLDGCRCTVDFKAAFTGAIVFTTHPTLPITASASYKTSSDAQMAIAGVAAYWDNGTARVAHTMFPSVLASGTTVGLYRASDGAAIAATVPITWANLDELTAHFEYEI